MEKRQGADKSPTHPLSPTLKFFPVKCDQEKERTRRGIQQGGWMKRGREDRGGEAAAGDAPSNGRRTEGRGLGGRRRPTGLALAVRRRRRCGRANADDDGQRGTSAATSTPPATELPALGNVCRGEHAPALRCWEEN